MDTLIRENLECGTFQADLPVDDIQIRAASVLGYPIHQHVLKAEAKKHSQDIRQWLAEKDIRPFAAGSVEKYMASKWALKPKSEDIGLSLVLMSMAGLLFTGTYCSFTFGNYWWLMSMPVGLLIVAFLGLIWFWGLKGEWKPVPISEFNEPVPEFALQVAIDIKERFSDAQLFIVQLVATTDPFLMLKLPDGTDLYLEVWNEPRFKQQRIN